MPTRPRAFTRRPVIGQQPSVIPEYIGLIREVCSQDANSRFIKCLQAKVLKAHI
jgi:hypothetical protein